MTLLLPQEVRDIGKEKELLILENSPPILCDKIKWYEDDLFASRGNQKEKMTWKLPNVPKIDPNERVIGKVEYDDANVKFRADDSQGGEEQEDERVVRSATPLDVKRRERKPKEETVKKELVQMEEEDER